MYELYPYFTNDGSVGLFSPEDDDIYHSTYGALSESWEKFTLPANIGEYFKHNKEIKILDICYGIGYNTKTALQASINEIEKFEKNNKNLFKNIFSKNNHKNFVCVNHNIDPIDTDNILTKNDLSTSELDYKNTSLNSKNILNNTINNGEIHSDNIFRQLLDIFSLNSAKDDKKNTQKKTFYVDAVDLDKVLMKISPFIINEFKSKRDIDKYFIDKYFKDTKFQNKLSQVQKIHKNKLISLPKSRKISKICNMILIMNLVNNFPELESDKILNSLVTQNKNSAFIDKSMLNFFSFYSNLGYKHKQKSKISAFLHNIYYRYISMSYKKARKMLEFSDFDINFHQNDARFFVKSNDNQYNFIFLDAFTPAKCPSLWTIEFFTQLFRLLSNDGIILTYSNSAAVRNAMIQNGFCVGKIFDKNMKKFIGTIAAKDETLIDFPLDAKDIDLINSKAGICYKDPNLDFSNDTIINNRENELSTSSLASSSSVMKEYKNAKI